MQWQDSEGGRFGYRVSHGVRLVGHSRRLYVYVTG